MDYDRHNRVARRQTLGLSAAGRVMAYQLATVRNCKSMRALWSVFQDLYTRSSCTY